MPTGPKHYRTNENGDYEVCRCMIGQDHGDDDDDDESLTVEDAANIWLSNGMDEDYTFGFSEEELKRAAGT